MSFIKIISYLLILSFSAKLSATGYDIRNLSFSRNNQKLQITIASLIVPFVDEKITNLNYSCKSETQIYPVHQCNDGSITAIIGKQKFNFGVKGWIDLSLNKYEMTLSNSNNDLFIKLNSENKQSLIVLIEDMKFSQLNKLLPFELELNGELEARINAQIKVDLSQTLRVTSTYQFLTVNYEDIEGVYVMADADISGNLTIEQINQGFAVKNTHQIKGGEALLKDLYVNFDDDFVQINSEFIVDSFLDVIDIGVDLIASNDDIVINLTSPNQSFDKITIDYSIKNLENFYGGFLASYFEILGIDDLEVVGQTHGKLKFVDKKINALDAEFSDFYLAIESKKININDLKAQLHWHEQGDALVSTVTWDELLLAGMPIKQSQLEFFSQAHQLWLRKGVSIPVFDGQILINHLKLDKIFSPEISIDFSGSLEPISIELITKKMEWPLMKGSLSGTIPGMKKIGRSIWFDGVLDIDVFEGQVQVENLTIERLFGIAPVIAADITFDKLNLQQITSTYDFGEITGQIKGYVKELRITNWKVDRLVSYIESVKTKGVKQNISQRAIDNISSIGGIQGALSRSFLRFFDYFNYKKIGIGCKLRNSICEMSGINDGSNNYTLIKGKGIPSINIIGFRKFIDWEIFIDRLLNAGY